MSTLSTTAAHTSWLGMMFSKQQVKMSLIISSIVGTVLNLINQGHLLATPEQINMTNIILTYSVPYCVTTLSSALSTLKHEKKAKEINAKQAINHNSDFFECVNLSIVHLNQKSKSGSLFANDLIKFVNELEVVAKSNAMNDSMKFESIKAMIDNDELSEVLVMIIEKVNVVSNQNAEALLDCEVKRAMLSRQREQLLNALQILDQTKN